jgi:hypothetical protein
MTRKTLTRASGLLALAATTLAIAQSNVVPPDQWSWNENTGWMNWRDAGGGALGVRLNGNHLEGWIWEENTGWTNVGPGGGPYLNTTGLNFGVNVDPATGFMSGFAWNENTGWINFDTRPSIGPQGARVDFSTYRLRGFAWAENTGWINLDDAAAFVQFAPCFADFDKDGDVDANDLAFLLGNWGFIPGNPADLVNNDDTVDANDLAFFLGAWGPCP